MITTNILRGVSVHILSLNILIIFVLSYFTLVRSIQANTQVNKTSSKNIQTNHKSLTPQWKEEKICVFGDTGTAGKGQYLVAGALIDENCKQIRHLGDLIYPVGLKRLNDPQFERKFLAPYKHFMQEKIPFFLTLGNHDSLGKPEIWVELSKIHEAIQFPALYYSDSFGPVCFFNLNTPRLNQISSWPFSNKETKKQIQWFKKEKKKLKRNCRFSIVLGHHPYRSSGFHGNAGSNLNRFFERHVVGKIDLILSGHEHQVSEEGTYKGTHQLISGAGSKTRGISSKKEGLFSAGELGYIVIKFTEDEKNKTVIAKYSLYSVTDEGKKVLNKQGSITGQGIRN